MTETTETMWCILELMGHKRLAGQVREEVKFGTSLIRVDVPETSETNAYTQWYNPTALYCITPTTEGHARTLAARLSDPPVHAFEIKQLRDALPEVSNSSPVVEPSYSGGADDFVSPPWDRDEEIIDKEQRESMRREAALPGSVAYLAAAKQRAHVRAKELLDMDIVILDLETTGLNRERSDHPIQIAIIDKDGKPLFNEAVKPEVPIDPGATRVHGKTDEDLQDARSFGEMADEVATLLEDKLILIYNAEYDIGILRNAFGKADPERATGFLHTQCVMQLYAEFHGEWNDYRGNFKWQKLVHAALSFDAGQGDCETHDALCDAQLALSVVRGMAIWEESKDDLPF